MVVPHVNALLAAVAVATSACLNYLAFEAQVHVYVLAYLLHHLDESIVEHLLVDS